MRNSLEAKEHQGIRPTPETKSKAVEGVVGQLQRRKFLFSEHVQAAHDIETAYRLITRPLECSLSDPARIGRQLDYAPTKDLEGRDLRLYNAFNRWADELESRRHSRGLYAITIDLVVEGFRLGFVEHRYQLPSGQGKHRLRESLGVYCTVNGRVI